MHGREREGKGGRGGRKRINRRDRCEQQGLPLITSISLHVYFSILQHRRSYLSLRGQEGFGGCIRSCSKHSFEFGIDSLNTKLLSLPPTDK
jgi:hypothetical protein